MRNFLVSQHYGETKYIDSMFNESTGGKLCEKVFTTKEKLFAHLRVHTNEKPFQCHVKGCNMTFSQKGNLKQHVIRMHMAVGFKRSAMAYENDGIDGEESPPSNATMVENDLQIDEINENEDFSEKYEQLKKR